MSNKSGWPGVSPEASARRAGGRRRFNRQRQEDAAARRYLVATMLPEAGLEYGVQSEIAEALGVHRSTISRDIQWLLGGKTIPCQTCGTRLTPEAWKRADRWERAQWTPVVPTQP